MIFTIFFIINWITFSIILYHMFHACLSFLSLHPQSHNNSKLYHNPNARYTATVLPLIANPSVYPLHRSAGDASWMPHSLHLSMLIWWSTWFSLITHFKSTILITQTRARISVFLRVRGSWTKVVQILLFTVKTHSFFNHLITLTYSFPWTQWFVYLSI